MSRKYVSEKDQHRWPHFAAAIPRGMILLPEGRVIADSGKPTGEVSATEKTYVKTPTE